MLLLPHHRSVIPSCVQVALLSLLLLLYSGALKRLSVAARMTTNSKSVLVHPKTVTIIETTPTDLHLSSWGQVDTTNIIHTNMHNVYLRRHPTSITNNKRTHNRFLYDTTDVVDHHQDHRMIQANRDDPPFPPAIGILIPIVLILVIVLVSCACCKCCYFYPYLCCVSHEDKEEILEGRKKKALPSELPNEAN